MLIRMVLGTLRSDRGVLVVLGALLLLVALLACTGAALMARLAGAGDSLLDRAEAPHLVQMHAGEVDEAEIARFAEDRPSVTAHRIASLLGLEGPQVELDGQSLADDVQQVSLVVPGPERDQLLDLADRPLAEVAPGTVHLPVYYRLEHGAEVGSRLVVTAADGFRRELVVAGFVRDSTMNTALAGSKRLAVHPDDLAGIAARTGTWEQLISFWVEDPSRDLAALRTDYQQAGLPSAGPMVDRSAFALFTVLAEGIVASIVLLGAVLVLAVALLCLRLALRTSLERDRRELAVMSLIGIPARDQGRPRLIVHGALALAAAAVGLLGARLLEPRLSAGLTAYVGGSGGPGLVIAPAAAAAALVVIVVLTVQGVQRRVRRTGALESLRGQGGAGTSTRSGAGRRLRPSLHGLPLPVGPALGLLALLRRGGGGVLLSGVFAVCTVLVLLPGSFASSLSSPEFSSQLGVGGAQVRLDLQHAGPDDASRFAEAREALAADPRIAAHTARTTTRHLVTGADGAQIALPIASGEHDDPPGRYAEGGGPRAADEIALSLLALDETGAAVGDELVVGTAAGERRLRIVGAYQDLTYGGLTAEAQLPSEGEEILWYVLGATLAPGQDAAAVAADLARTLPGVRVSEAAQYRAQLLGPLEERMAAVSGLAVLASLALAVLVAAMLARLWIAAETAPLAIRRALGTSPSALRTPYLARMLLPLGLGLLLGTAITLTAGQGLVNLLLEGMFGGIERLFSGTSRIALDLDPLTMGLALPLAAAVLASTLLACRGIRTADVRSLPAE